MSHYPDPSPNADSGNRSVSSSIFSPLESQFKPAPVSNLTKNLLSSGQFRQQDASRNADSAAQQNNPNPEREGNQYAEQHPGSVSSSTHAPIPTGQPISSSQNHDPSQNPGFQFQSSLFTTNPSYSFYRQAGNPNSNSTNMNYIPLGHNAPTIVSSSYTSNYSHTPSFRSASAHFIDRNDNTSTSNPMGQGFPNQLAPHVQTGFLPSSYNSASMGHGPPTTNLNVSSVNSSSSPFHHGPGSHRSSISAAPQLYQPQFEAGPHHVKDQVAQSLPSGGIFQRSHLPHHQGSSFANDALSGLPSSFANASSRTLGSLVNISGGSAADSNRFLSEPDHYMTYDEYLELLNKRDAEVPPTGDNGYDEHLNIVKFPVNDLITMLACLLTKIIEANDKLHPNHFDTTIAIRQKLKEEKKKKKMEREASRQRSVDSMSYSNDDINTTVEVFDEDVANSSGDEQDMEDELKNRYLANVLAFHGTNIPGISLNAYLTRVLKYCPVTNEVFLSLLVYFDRIAKKANNLKKNLENGEGEAEQLFVMDSYNIHRLIILGITVSSKFFSDIFYKNLRYAKVGGLPLEELNYLELQFLLLLDFKLMISVEDLQNYGDLLLKFWKREQLATNLVNDANKAEASFTAASS